MEQRAKHRSNVLAAALTVQWITIAWMLLEGVIAIRAALVAGSLSLLGFGVDSFVELLSAVVVMQRLRIEYRDVGDFNEAIEKRTALIAGLLLLALAAYVLVAAVIGIARRQGQSFDLLGLTVTAIAFVFMLWLARRKWALAHALESRALRADAAEATACAYLSLTVFIGLVAQYLFGWWWIDAVVSLGIVYFLVKEAREALTGDDCAQ